MTEFRHIDRPDDWAASLSPDVMSLYNRAYKWMENGWFDDMLFRPGSSTGEFLAYQFTDENGKEIKSFDDAPEKLEHFSYEDFTFVIADLGEGDAGQFDYGKQELTITPEYIHDDDVLLHELIHLHEFVLESLPMYFRDICLCCLYRDLRAHIPDLDGRMTGAGNLIKSDRITNTGGVHDILFLLKSYDSDLRQGYPLGKVYGYGIREER